jgi:hypothetical protein
VSFHEISARTNRKYSQGTDTPKALTCAYTCIVFQRISQSSLRRYEYCLVFPLDYGSLSPDRIAERRDSQAI